MLSSTNAGSLGESSKSEHHLREVPKAILQRADQLAPGDLDRLPFGAIQLDRDGTILRFNEYEANLTNRRAPETIGRNFFTDVAPCTDVKEFHGRFLEGLERGELEVSFPFVFRFPRKARQVDVTLYYSSPTRTIWVFVIERTLSNASEEEQS